MKKFIKWGLIIFVGLIVLSMFIPSPRKEATPQVEVQTATESATVAPTEKPVQKEAGQSGTATGDITMAKFNQLQSGMSYAQVVATLGREGEVTSTSDMAGYTTTLYMWRIGSFGANMNVMIQNDKMVSKAQLGLK